MENKYKYEMLVKAKTQRYYNAQELERTTACSTLLISR